MRGFMAFCATHAFHDTSPSHYHTKIAGGDREEELRADDQCRLFLFGLWHALSTMNRYASSYKYMYNVKASNK